MSALLDASVRGVALLGLPPLVDELRNLPPLSRLGRQGRGLLRRGSPPRAPQWGRGPGLLAGRRPRGGPGPGNAGAAGSADPGPARRRLDGFNRRARRSARRAPYGRAASGHVPATGHPGRCRRSAVVGRGRGLVQPVSAVGAVARAITAVGRSRATPGHRRRDRSPCRARPSCPGSASAGSRSSRSRRDTRPVAGSPFPPRTRRP